MRDMNPKVLYEDDYFLVIDKPAGVVVNRAESVKEETVQDWVKKLMNFTNPANLADGENEDFIARDGIVHRLDKETSGLLLIAKTPRVFANLQEQFKNRQVKKKYIALVHGMVRNDHGVIKNDLGRLPWNRERFGLLGNGKYAETEYKAIKRLSVEATEEMKRKHPGQDYGFTLLEVSPKTGRTHQIRVHLKSIGHPVVSDELYAGRKTAREDRRWCKRMFLHACLIEFLHTETGESVRIECALPDDLKEAVRGLEARGSF